MSCFVPVTNQLTQPLPKGRSMLLMWWSLFYFGSYGFSSREIYSRNKAIGNDFRSLVGTHYSSESQ